MPSWKRHGLVHWRTQSAPGRRCASRPSAGRVDDGGVHLARQARGVHGIAACATAVAATALQPTLATGSATRGPAAARVPSLGAAARGAARLFGVGGPDSGVVLASVCLHALLLVCGHVFELPGVEGAACSAPWAAAPRHGDGTCTRRTRAPGGDRLGCHWTRARPCVEW